MLHDVESNQLLVCTWIWRMCYFFTTMTVETPCYWYCSHWLILHDVESHQLLVCTWIWRISYFFRTMTVETQCYWYLQPLADVAWCWIKSVASMYMDLKNFLLLQNHDMETLAIDICSHWLILHDVESNQLLLCTWIWRICFFFRTMTESQVLCN